MWSCRLKLQDSYTFFYHGKTGDMLQSACQCSALWVVSCQELSLQLFQTCGLPWPLQPETQWVSPGGCSHLLLWQGMWAVPELDIPMPGFGRDVGVVRGRCLTCLTTVNFTIILCKLLHSSFDMWRIFVNDPHGKRNICQLLEYSHNFFLLKYFFLWDWDWRSSDVEQNGVEDKECELSDSVPTSSRYWKWHCVLWQIVLFSFYHKSGMSQQETPLWPWTPE